MIYFVYSMERKQTQRAERPIAAPETVRGPEVGREQVGEQREAQESAAPSEQVRQTGPVSIQVPTTPQATVAPKDPQLVQVESVLSEGLEDLYKGLPPNMKPQFKAKGEEVATQINVWMQEAKLAAKKVLHLIREWLGMVPQMNKHYLEQESKIKTDRIMQLAETGETDLLV